MSVKIGDIIYQVYFCDIYKRKVYMLGEESFAHDETWNTGSNEDGRRELFYKDEGEVWFRSLDKAKKKLRSCFEEKVRITQMDESWWKAK